MLNKTALYMILGLTMLVYIGTPLYMIFSYENVLKEGEVFKFRPRPVDPYHPFQGRYIALNYENDKQAYAGADSIFQYGEKAYLPLKKDSAGFAIQEQLLLSPPKDQAYLEVEISYSYEDEVHFNYPFTEYFMNEKLAPEAEAVYRTFSREAKEEDVYVDIRVKDGMAIIEELYIQGKPIIEFLNEQRIK